MKFSTSVRFRRFTSHKSRLPISVDMYQPLKAVAVNIIPPQSNIMLETAGSAYQRKPSSSNHSYLEERNFVEVARRAAAAVEVITSDARSALQAPIPRANRSSRDRVHWRTAPAAGCPSRSPFPSSRASCTPADGRNENETVSAAESPPPMHYAYFCELNHRRIANEASVQRAIASVGNQLVVPNAVVVAAVVSLRENRYCRPLLWTKAQRAALL